jgi:type IV fimbrial biogenesis protein FimT
MRNALRGLGLIELLLSLALLAFLLLRLAQPAWQHAHERHQTNLMMQELQQLIAMARHSAIAENQVITLCRSNDGRHCQGQWRDGSIMFTDSNADQQLNGSERLLFRSGPLPLAGELRFNAFRNRQYLLLTPQGVTDFQNGNFTWCPASGDLRLARQLILSASGRTRMAVDSDGDQVVEDSQGQPLRCDS